jgi:hypothetical protein
MKHIITSALFLLIVFCISAFIFEPSHLYFELPWLDIPMHVIGGLGVAVFVTAIATHGKQKLSLTQVLILYLCVALVWELYEFVKDVVIQKVEWNGWSDTLADIFNGGVGAIVAYLFLKK